MLAGGLFDARDVSPQPGTSGKGAAQRAYREQLLARQPIPSDWARPEIPELNGEKRIILNAETTGLKWWDGDKPVGWSYCLPKSGRFGYLPIRHRPGDNLPIEQVHAFLGDLKHVHVENINTKFDLHMAREDGTDLTEQKCTFGDAAHYAALLDDHRVRFNLDQLSLDCLGWNVERDGLGKQPAVIENESEFQYLHPAVVAPYAVRNVEQVWRLIEKFEPSIDEEDLNDVVALEQDILPVVVEMEKNGTILDLDLLDRWRTEVSVKIEDKLRDVFKATGVRMSSFDSAKEIAQVFQRAGIPITSFTEKGAPSFTDDVLRHIDHPIARMIREGGQLADLDSKYLTKYWDDVRKSDGWLRFNLHQLRSVGDGDSYKGTVSGRFSGAGDRFGGYNPQQVVAVEKQLERGWCSDYVVRKLFLSNFAADMMQVEYRLFADYAEMHAPFHARPLRKQIGGKWVWIQGPLADFHALVAELLTPINPALNRKLVKNINFAMIYGAGLVKFALMLGLITEKEFAEFSERLSMRDWSVFDEPGLAKAKQLRETYLKMFPKVKPLLDQASRVAEQRGYVKTLMGRRARLAGRFHSALNRVIQGGAADINKRVLVELYRQRKKLGLTLRLTVHDEVVGDLADTRTVGDVKRVLNKQYFNLKVPILWDAKTGANWAACK